MYDVWLYNGKNQIQINGRRTNDMIEGTFTRGKNAIPTCQFNIYPDNVGFNFLLEYSTLIRIFDADGKQVFGGRVLSVQPNMDSSGAFFKAVTCEGWMGYLNDSTSYEGTLLDRNRGQVLYQLLDHHNSLVNSAKSIELGQGFNDNTYLDFHDPKKTTFEAMMGEEMLSTGNTYEVIEDNGVLKLDYWHQTELSSVEIELGKNLESLNIQNHFNELCTRVIPWTSEGVPLGDPIEHTSPYIDASASAIGRYGLIVKHHTFDGVTDVNKLPGAAKLWLEQNSVIKSSFSVSAVDLFELGLTNEKFDLYKIYHVVCEPLSIDEWIELTQITQDLNDEWNVQLTFGEKSILATQYKRR